MVLASGLPSDAIEQPGEDEPEHDAATGPDDQPDDVVAQDPEELGLGHHRVVGEREGALVVLEAAQDRSRRGVEQEDRQSSARAGPTKTHGRIRSRHFGGSRLTSEPTPMNSSQMPPTPTARAIAASNELGDYLVARAVPQVGRAGRIAERVVDRGQQVRPALRVVQDEDATQTQAEGDQPEDGQDDAGETRALGSSDGHASSSRR